MMARRISNGSSHRGKDGGGGGEVGRVGEYLTASASTVRLLSVQRTRKIKSVCTMALRIAAGQNRKCRSSLSSVGRK